MLDDMLKIFLDPYFKPKKVNEPERENLFELVYSPGNTINSKDKVNHRREISWDGLYITEEAKEEFLTERFTSTKQKLMKARIVRSVNRTPKDSELRRSITVRDDTQIVNPISNDPVKLYSAYGFNKSVLSNPRLNQFETSKGDIDKIFEGQPAKTETRFPRIRNPSDERYTAKLSQKQFSNHNE